MKLSNRGVRSVAMLTGVAVAASTLMPMQAAHAADKKKTYKYGAIGLGALGAILAVKGKTLPAVAAGAGAYYAYKKSKDADNDRTAGDIYPDSTRRTQRRADWTRRVERNGSDVYASRSTPSSSDVDRSESDYSTDTYPDDPGYVGLSAKSADTSASDDSREDNSTTVLK